MTAGDACMLVSGNLWQLPEERNENPDAEVECSQQRRNLPSSPPLYCTDRAGCSKPMVFLPLFIILASTFLELIFRLPRKMPK